MPDLANRQETERKLVSALTRVLNDSRLELARELWREGMTYADLQTLPPMTMQNITRRLSNTLAEQLQDAYIEAGQTFATAIGFGLAVDALEDRASRWANTYAPQLAQQLIATSTRRLQDVAQRLADTTLSQASLAGVLGTVFMGRSGTRIAQIAQTEITNAVSQGEQVVTSALAEDGVTSEMVWYSQLDERVCSVCAPRHGTVQGDGWTTPPPAHARCRCYLGYRITSADGSVRIIFDDEDVRTQMLRGASRRRARGQ